MLKIGFFFPFKKTRLREIAINKGFYDPTNEKIYDPSLPALFFKNMSDQELIALRARFTLYVKLPKEFWPYIERSEKNDELGRRLTNKLHKIYNFQYSPVKIGTFHDRLCHYYKKIPEIIPGFIYLDGPAPKDVHGKINGLSFQHDERTVMSDDLLLMESTFLPGMFILVDGRTNNARFLKNNFQRQYAYHWDKTGDVTTFELIEPRLGKYNLLGTDFIKNNKQ